MRLATVAQSRIVDELTQNEYGIPSEVLMETAGALSAREITLGFYPEVRMGRVGVVCGPGNNGGDGLVVARHLHAMGCRGIQVFLLAPPEKRSRLMSLELSRCEQQGLNPVDLYRQPEAIGNLLQMNCIVDAIFGIGLSSDVSSAYRDVIEAMNSCATPVVSLDTPSGLDADRGVVRGVAVKAAMTLTFGLAKPGFMVSDGPPHVGRLRVIPIGFPRELLRKTAVTHFGWGESRTKRVLPKRRITSNKTQHGQAMLFAGSDGMWGAALLVSSAAYRVGAGYVRLASWSEPIDVLRENPEILTSRIDNESIWAHRKWHVAGVGPGLGVGADTARLIERLKALQLRGVVADADAITVIARERLYPLPKNWILTPHAGELSRLLGVDASEIESNRFHYAREAARKTGCHVLLKGFRTVLSDGEKAWVVLSGNSALAKAGTGDVLTGMITGLAAQGLEIRRAAASAAYLHGRLADEWVRNGCDRRSLQASDLREMLPSLMAHLAHR